MLKSLSVVRLFVVILLGFFGSSGYTASIVKEQKTDHLYSDFGGANTPEEISELWDAISKGYFGERVINESQSQQIVKIDIPARAENDALVPLTITTSQPSSSLKIKKVYLSVDVNPAPMAGVFTLAPDRPLEEIATRVRVNGYTYVRAIAELSDGSLYMDKQWVKSRGAGCSAPPGMNQADHKKKLGNIRFRVTDAELPSSPLKHVQLRISHPNNTGMQRDQLSTLFIPQHYVENVLVTFNDQLVLEAETTFSISENPSFRFTFNQNEEGELKAVARDTKGNEFTATEKINKEAAL